MMNYNDKLNIPGLESDTPVIIKYITDNFPEYLKANSFVTIDFIKLVSKAQYMVSDAFDDEDDSFFNITDKDAQGILTNLSKEAIAHLLSPEMLH